MNGFFVTLLVVSVISFGAVYDRFKELKKKNALYAKLLEEKSAIKPNPLEAVIKEAEAVLSDTMSKMNMCPWFAINRLENCTCQERIRKRSALIIIDPGCPKHGNPVAKDTVDKNGRKADNGPERDNPVSS